MRVAMQVEIVIALNATNDNVLQGKQFQTVPFNAVVKLLDTGSATGLKRSFNVSGTQVIDAGFVNIQNRVPVEPDDTVISDVEAYQGQMLFLAVQNTTAGNLTYRALVVIESASEA